VRREVPARLELTGVGAAAAGVSAALAATGVALVPIATTFAPSLPYTMKAVTLPRWYATVAPHLPPNRVLLSYPVPFSGIQVAMAWQAVNGMNYSQVGGGGPQGVSARAGAARGGFNVLSPLAFGVFVPQPPGTPAEFAATRHALDVWRVTTVVIATNPTVPVLQRGHDPTYAAAFMTAALGRLPVIEAGAWVWNNVSVSHGSALIIPPGSLKTCVSLVERGRRGLPAIATLKVADCVGLEALSVAR
jgi:hypothetical protein